MTQTDYDFRDAKPAVVKRFVHSVERYLGAGHWEVDSVWSSEDKGEARRLDLVSTIKKIHPESNPRTRVRLIELDTLLR